MARYIDADIVLPKIQYRERTYGCSSKMYSKVIKDAPTADVRPERHGSWKPEGDCGITKCSVCRWSIEECIDWNYCPYCGAKMGGSGKSDNWIATSEQLPVENQIVETKIDDEKGVRNEQELIYSHNLWFLPDKSMYVYYTPTHWRRRERTGGKDGNKNE